MSVINPTKTHWENIYQNKTADEMSWTELVPETSLNLIGQLQLPKSASIIDIGGGESHLAAHLMDAGYTNITILDISEKSIERSKMELGARADQIKWIAGDITNFQPGHQYDCWHDRAVFHFLTSPGDVTRYYSSAKWNVRQNGFMIIATFSEKGPEYCSGLPVRQYNPESLNLAFSDGFQKLRCIVHDHETPFKTKQNFIYCLFRKF